MPIIKYEHHGKRVSVEAHLKGKHPAYCLCWQQCKYFKPNTEANCHIAQLLFEFDKKHGITTPVWECAEYEQIDSETERP